MRSYARETAFCKIYTYIMCGEYDGDYSQFDADKLTETDVQFADALVRYVIENKSALDTEIASLSKAFRLSRIYRPDLAALEMAMGEINMGDTPVPVAINEAVTIVKKYSTEKSVSYVNGILGAFVRDRQ